MNNSTQNPNRERKRSFLVRLDENEMAALEQKMKRLGIKNREAFVRKMINDGYIIEINTKPVAELARLLKNATTNINQVSKRANETGSIYEQDVLDLLTEFNRLKPLVVEAYKIVARLKKS